MTSSKWCIILLLFIAMVAASSNAQRTYVVGDDAVGWGFDDYTAWTSNKEFFVGDTLVFNFPDGAHDVAELSSKADFESCTTSTVSNHITTSPARIILTTPGEHFFVCTVPMHCNFGMKLAVNVSPATTSPHSNPTPTPSPSGVSIAPSSVPSNAPAGGFIAPLGAPSSVPSGGIVLRPSPASVSNVINVAAASMSFTTLLSSIAFVVFTFAYLV